MMNKKIVDIIIVVGLLLVAFVGLMTAKNMRQTASKQIEATSNIQFDVFLRSVTMTSDECPIKEGDKTFISIRNVPYSDLEVVSVKFAPKKAMVSIKKGVVAVVDEGQDNMFDIVVRVKDVAQITKDGAVVGGNKIKMGLPITLEGKLYKFTGSVSDVAIEE